MSEIHLVKGKIWLGKDIHPFSGAVAYVCLLDVGKMDVSSTLVAKKTITNITHVKGQETYVPFNLYGGKLDERSDYTVRVHISLQGSEAVLAGDYVTMENYPITPSDKPIDITVTVREVTE